jgi:hypothetical protein
MTIISLRVEVLANKASLTLPLLLAPIQESEPSCICVLGVLILPVSTVFDWVNFRTVTDSVVFILELLRTVWYLFWTCYGQCCIYFRTVMDSVVFICLEDSVTQIFF